MPSFDFPVALALAGRRCVVVGGGTVGARRSRSLLDAGADVVVVDPRETDLPSGAVAIREPFSRHHLEGAFLVVVATDDAQVNRFVVEQARLRSVLVNNAAPAEGGDPGDFAVMATVTRGPFSIGVSGGGPAASRWVRDRVDNGLEPWIAEWGTALEGARRRLAASAVDERHRRQCLAALVQDDSLRARFAQGDTATALGMVDAVVDAVTAGVHACRS